MTRETGSYRLVGMMEPELEAEYRELVSRLSLDELDILMTLESGDWFRQRDKIRARASRHAMKSSPMLVRDVELRRIVRKKEMIMNRKEELLRERRKRRE